VRAVRAEVGDEVPVFVRISATDWVEPEGWTLEQSVQLASWIYDAGGDVVDTSSGGLITGVSIPSAPGYQVPHAHTIKTGSGVLTTAVGQIVEAHQAEEIVAAGKADAVFVGRQFIRGRHLRVRGAAGPRGRGGWAGGHARTEGGIQSSRRDREPSAAAGGDRG